MEVQFPPELEGKLNRLAAEQGRETESLVFEAVEILVGQLASHNDWFLAEVEKGSGRLIAGNSSIIPQFVP